MRHYPKDDDWGDWMHEVRKQKALDRRWDEESRERHVRVLTDTTSNAGERREREALLRWLRKDLP